MGNANGTPVGECAVNLDAEHRDASALCFAAGNSNTDATAGISCALEFSLLRMIDPSRIATPLDEEIPLPEYEPADNYGYEDVDDDDTLWFLPSSHFLSPRWNLRRCKSEDPEKECPICCTQTTQSGWREVVSCGHAFHRTCLREWRKMQRTCPMCRGSLLSADSSKELMAGSPVGAGTAADLAAAA